MGKPVRPVKALLLPDEYKGCLRNMIASSEESAKEIETIIWNIVRILLNNESRVLTLNSQTMKDHIDEDKQERYKGTIVRIKSLEPVDFDRDGKVDIYLLRLVMAWEGTYDHIGYTLVDQFRNTDIVTLNNLTSIYELEYTNETLNVSINIANPGDQ